jgi:membrane protease YdiL (CAAX protease family)
MGTDREHIGAGFSGKSGALLLASVTATIVVGMDVLMAANVGIAFEPRFAAAYHSELLALATFVIYAALLRLDRHSLGLRLRPVQGYLYWLKAGLLIGLIVVLCCGSFYAMKYFLLGIGLPAYRTPANLSVFVERVLRVCIMIPLVQELIYRFALCVPSTALLGRNATILLSGSLFALIHYFYGILGPGNLLAGFFFAWAYLHSGTLWVPIALHSLGNLCVLIYVVLKPLF